MSKNQHNNGRIRRVPSSEKAGRAWPDKSQQASSYPGMLNPDPTKKDPIHSLITGLPILMLLVGLAFWYFKESAQQTGKPLLAESVQFSGEYNGVSKAQALGDGQFFFWLMQDGTPKPFRINPEQYAEYGDKERGVAVVVTAAPTVQDSDTLWVVEVATP